VAAAGPAVSLGLAAVGFGLAFATSLPAFMLLGWVNLLLGLFNLLPAFPSDGGRILRAVLAQRRGLVRATDLAVQVSRWVCAAIAVGGVALTSIQMILVAGVLWMMGSAERAAARLRGDSGHWRGRDDRLITEVEYIPPGAGPRPQPAPRPHVVLDARGRPVIVVRW
jgi:Zn-dependent protease